MRPPTQQAGYTLLELLVVISILMMSYMFITPFIGGKSGGTHLNAASQQIVGELRVLRSSAIAQAVVLHFEITEDGHGYRTSGHEDVIKLSGDITVTNILSDPISFYPDGTNSGINLLLKAGENGRYITSGWPLGKVEVRDAV